MRVDLGTVRLTRKDFEDVLFDFTSLDYWQERDRLHVGLKWKDDLPWDTDIIDYWDEDAGEFLEDSLAGDANRRRGDQAIIRALVNEVVGNDLKVEHFRDAIALWVFQAKLAGGLDAEPLDEDEEVEEGLDPDNEPIRKNDILVFNFNDDQGEQCHAEMTWDDGEGDWMLNKVGTGPGKTSRVRVRRESRVDVNRVKSAVMSKRSASQQVYWARVEQIPIKTPDLRVAVSALDVPDDIRDNVFKSALLGRPVRKTTQMWAKRMFKLIPRGNSTAVVFRKGVSGPGDITWIFEGEHDDEALAGLVSQILSAGVAYLAARKVDALEPFLAALGELSGNFDREVEIDRAARRKASRSRTAAFRLDLSRARNLEMPLRDLKVNTIDLPIPEGVKANIYGAMFRGRKITSQTQIFLNRMFLVRTGEEGSVVSFRKFPGEIAFFVPGLTEAKSDEMTQAFAEILVRGLSFLRRRREKVYDEIVAAIGKYYSKDTEKEEEPQE